jgi:uncharacterized repeat protein (TIGR03803 family)
MRTVELRSGTKMFFVALLVTLFATPAAQAAHEKILHDFVDLPSGANPQANLIADTAGNLYGTTPNGGEFGYGAVFELSPGKNGNSNETVLHSFASGGDGAEPLSGLIFDNAGNLYGTTAMGGSLGQNSCTENRYVDCGAVFELMPDGHGNWTESVLHRFNGYPNDGQNPFAGLISDAAGNLYGTTSGGGSYDRGTVFELTPGSNGSWTETILYNFTGGADGASPSASLIFDSAGNLYSTTEYGGDMNCNGPSNTTSCGTVFELTPNAGGPWTEVVLHSFTYVDGAYPVSNVIFDATGNLYGTTPDGPGFACNEGGCGTVYRLTPNSDGSWIETMIYNFAGGPDGVEPVAGLIFDGDGNLYGTTQYGGDLESCYKGCGTVFQLTPRSKGNWIEKVIHRFGQPTHGQNDGLQPLSGLFLDQAGNLYGTAAYGGYQSCYDFFGCGTVFRLSPDSSGNWTPSLLYAFTTGRLGVGPIAGVISDGTGNLYGTAQVGGSGDYGVAFELTPQSEGAWKETVLHTFIAGSDGAYPDGSLVFDTAGNLYGTTLSGGSKECSGYSECGGVVFELSPTTHGWKESVLHRFASNISLGQNPMSGVIFDPVGNLYGTTADGGSTSCGSYGCGTVYKLSPIGGGKWHEDVLHLFQGGNDGSGPLGNLVFDQAGNLYGTTCDGGANDNGTVFELSPKPSGKWKKSVLYSFQGFKSNDGNCPRAGLIFDGQGDLYGTTYYGGDYSCSNYGCGTVFRLSPRGTSVWTETVLYAFQNTDGSNPQSPLTFDAAGNLYGTAAPENGTLSDGVVFELSPGSKRWTERVLHHFGKGFDGTGPIGPLIFDSTGNIYGTTNAGGTGDSGTVFELSAGSDGEWFDNILAPAAPTRGFRPPRFKPDVGSVTPLVRNAPQGEVSNEK